MNKRLIIYFINALCILSVALWGWFTDQWYFRQVGEGTEIYEIIAITIFMINLPASIVGWYVASLIFKTNYEFEFITEYILVLLLSFPQWKLYMFVYSKIGGSTKTKKLNK